MDDSNEAGGIGDGMDDSNEAGGVNVDPIVTTSTNASKATSQVSLIVIVYVLLCKIILPCFNTIRPACG